MSNINELLLRRREIMSSLDEWNTVSGIPPITVNTKKLKSIELFGKCDQNNILVWNQLVSGARHRGSDLVQDINGFFHLTSNSFSSYTTGYISFLGDSTTSSDNRNTSTINHQYYFKFEIKNVVATNVEKFQGYYAQTYNRDITFDGSTSYEHENIYTCNYNRTVLFRFFPVSGETASIDCDIRCMAVDLTLLYGEGNEPSTIQDFKDSYAALFGHQLDYEPYNPGTVLGTQDIICNNGVLKISKNFANINFTTTSVASVQFSSVNQKLKAYGTITGGSFANFSLTSYATAANLSLLVSNSSGVTKFETGKTYYVYLSDATGIQDLRLVSSDKTESTSITLTNGAAIFTPSVDCCDLWVRYYGQNELVDIETTVQIEESSVPTEYHPFHYVYVDNNDSIVETIQSRFDGITPINFIEYQATSEKISKYSYKFIWSTASGQSWNGVYASDVSIIIGHKYYMCSDFKVSTPSTLAISFSSGLTGVSKSKSDVTSNTTYNISTISTATETSSSIIMYIRAGYADVGDDYIGEVKNIGLFDLTNIFGEGNEPSTANEARTLLGFDTATSENLLGLKNSYNDIQEIIKGTITKNVGIKILTGKETFALDNWRPYNGTYAFALYKDELPNILEKNTDNILCTHLKSNKYSSGGGLYYGGTGICIYSSSGSYSIFIRVPNSIATDTTSMKNWLANQHANGTPVMIVYPLNESIPGESVTRQNLSILEGNNTLEVIQSYITDSKIKIKYKPKKKDNNDYLSFIATQDNSSISLTLVGSPTAVNLEYSFNKTSWFPYNINSVIAINKDQVIYIRKADDSISTSLSKNSNNYYQFVIIGNIRASGNVMSLLDKSCESLEVGSYCFYHLFYGCSSLISPPKLPATTLDTYCYGSMFLNCSSLITAPELPATTLANNCYYQMFYKCYGLTSFPRLQFTTMANKCFSYMFYDCKNIQSYHISSLNTSTNVFYQNIGCNSLTIDAITPPTIESNTITGLKSDCIIYVPSESVQSYKEKQYWSDRASYIQAKPSE